MVENNISRFLKGCHPQPDLRKQCCMKTWRQQLCTTCEAVHNPSYRKQSQAKNINCAEFERAQDITAPIVNQKFPSVLHSASVFPQIFFQILTSLEEKSMESKNFHEVSNSVQKFSPS